MNKDRLQKLAGINEGMFAGGLGGIEEKISVELDRGDVIKLTHLLAEERDRLLDQMGPTHVGETTDTQRMLDIIERLGSALKQKR